jgi:hypothetical protein
MESGALTVIRTHEIIIAVRTFFQPSGASGFAWPSENARLENITTMRMKIRMVSSWVAKPVMRRFTPASLRLPSQLLLEAIPEPDT